jgi:opacity protein-like surface antigen
MSASRSALLAGAAVLMATAGGVNAADLYGGGMKDGGYAVESYAPPAGPAGYYFRLDGGYAGYNVGDVSLHDQDLVGNGATVFSDNDGDAGGGWFIGGGFGKYLGRGFRGEVTLEYRGKTDIDGYSDASCCEVEPETQFDGIVGLASLYYDFNRGGRFTPYIGAGIGFAHLRTNGGVFGCQAGGASGHYPDCHDGGADVFGDATFDGQSTINFAAAAMAGFSMKIRGGEPTYIAGGMKDEVVQVSGGRGVYLDVGYRFMYLGDVDGGTAFQENGNRIDVKWDDLTSHEVRAGLRFDLH